jgi:hypothetical protein
VVAHSNPKPEQLCTANIPPKCKKSRMKVALFDFGAFSLVETNFEVLKQGTSTFFMHAIHQEHQRWLASTMITIPSCN